MLKIGLIDYYFDNWHTNYYPGFLREAIKEKKLDAQLVGAYAYVKSPTEISNEAWCEDKAVQLYDNAPDLIDSVDAIMVMAADNSDWKELCVKEALCSGKPVFVDKTFAPNLETGKRFFETAEKHRTPVFSASAQRYCADLIRYLEREKGNTRFMSTVGPHDLSNYAVHQFEPIVAVMGTDIKRVKAFSVDEKVTQLIVDYGDGKLASFTQTPNPWAEFNFMVSDGKNGERLDSSDYYPNLMYAMLDFFLSGVSSVPKEETLTILALIDAAKAARQYPDEWRAFSI